LLVNVTCPVKLPEDCGVKVTVKGILVPAGMVTGKLIPLKEKPEPLRLAPEITTLAPVALNDAFWLLLLPTVTVPKLRVEEFTPSCPEPAIPVAVRFTTSAWAVPAIVIDNWPLALFAALGRKLTVTAALCPGSSENGTAGAETLNPVPVAEICVTVPVALPLGAELVRVSVLDLRWPTVTLPKFRAADLRVNLAGVGLAVVEDISDRLPHETEAATASRRQLKMKRLRPAF